MVHALTEIHQGWAIVKVALTDLKSWFCLGFKFVQGSLNWETSWGLVWIPTCSFWVKFSVDCGACDTFCSLITCETCSMSLAHPLFPFLLSDPSSYACPFMHFHSRSIGKVKEAEAIEQQMRAKGGSVPPSGGPQVLGITCLNDIYLDIPLSVWWSASIWGSAPVWRSTSGWTAVLLSWQGGLAKIWIIRWESVTILPVFRLLCAASIPLLPILPH